MITTNPSELANASRCYNECIPQGMQLAVIIYILANQAGLENLTPSQLANLSRCYNSCIPAGEQISVINYLLNQLVNGSATTCAALSGAGDPTGVTTPEFSGQLYHDTTNDVYYRSTGTTSADWTLISGGGEPCSNVEGAGDPT